MNKDDLINFHEEFETVVAGTALSNCNSISIFNISSVAGTVMLVNGVPIGIGFAYESEGNGLENNTTKYTIAFSPNNNDGVAMIVRKLYDL